MHFHLAPVFGDGMVLQRNRPVRLYGEADQPITLTVTLGEITRTGSFAKGPFQMLLPPLKAAAGLVLYLTDGEDTQILRDIACGEVWIAGGQSNMAMSLSGTAKEEWALIPDCADIRFYTVGRNSLETPAEYGAGFEWAYSADSGWLRCDEHTAPYFSAVGYHFAQKLYAALGVPVGIISCNVGGSRMFSWLPEQVISDDPAIAGLAGLAPDDRPPETLLAEYQAYMAGWKEGRDSLDNTAGTASEMPCVYYEWNSRYSYKRPSCLYTGMLRKISRYTARGVIWYQGESEAMDGYAGVYLSTLETLVKLFCREQEEPELAFELVQLAPWSCTEIRDWESVSDQQRRFSLRYPQYGMVTIGDCGGDDIHPVTKKPVGERLALAALCRAYGYSCEYSGPIAVSAHRYGDRVLVRFTHSEGLYAAGEAPVFVIRYADETEQRVCGTVEGECVHLPCDPSKEARFVEYEYRIDAKIGLYNAQHIPASLFRLEIREGGSHDEP